MDAKHCAGCRNDFYNGNNQMGIGKCWSLESAQLVNRWRAGWWDPPNLAMRCRVPSCFVQTGIAAYSERHPQTGEKA